MPANQHEYELLHPLAVDAGQRQAAADELAWLMRAAGPGATAPAIKWWRFRTGGTAAEYATMPIPVNGWTDPNVKGAINLVTRKFRAIDPDELENIRATVRHETAHHWEIAAGRQPTIIHAEGAAACSALARRWRKRRPDAMSIRALTDPAYLDRVLTDCFATLGEIQAARKAGLDLATFRARNAHLAKAAMDRAFAGSRYAVGVRR